MKRLNITIDGPLYDRVRALAFLKRSSISGIIRLSLQEWLKQNADQREELILSETDEERLLKILANDEFVPVAKVRKKFSR